MEKLHAGWRQVRHGLAALRSRDVYFEFMPKISSRFLILYLHLLSNFAFELSFSTLLIISVTRTFSQVTQDTFIGGVNALLLIHISVNYTNT